MFPILLTRDPPGPLVQHRAALRLAAAHALVVQAEQAPGGIIRALQLRILLPVVLPPELVFGVERGRVQALSAAERLDFVLDKPVVVAVGLAGRERNRAPEAEIHVDVTRLERVERPGLAGAQPQRAHPHRAHADVAEEEVEEGGAALDRDLDVLYDVLARADLARGVHLRGEPVPAVERDEPPVDVGPPVPARPQPADRPMLDPERA